ncbi:carbamoyltransferase HypF [Shewanella psychrotolerans]|uniref:carbamoyltransferase HypF n=1 Tax=Shewanella psychrotolerans TaxID=2864206 RepID=UPI001C65BEEA|nr:carbamoyltransferase HypF [Shewanella psychrotolerans]QYK02977.1 carbamoyltransferase HypF [Shewanella psychrotolerans]
MSICGKIDSVDSLPSNKIERVKLAVSGIVQGVGFRPFVYRLAKALQLNGFTFNHSQGVTIELQGARLNIDKFVSTLKQNPPPLARIDRFTQQAIAPKHECYQFEIKQSQASDDAQVAVSADKSSCQDCLDEINDPDNRHYHYPFTNCTNCGPRYTLINTLPYDRKNTSMATFEMCEQCAKAYNDPLDRRYHAQPVSCPRCGPSLSLTSATGEILATKETALEQTVSLLKQGDILAIKGLGGFHLVCDATNDAAVTKLRLRKQRPAKPFAVMCSDLAMAKTLAKGSDAEWQLLNSAERPITLLERNNEQHISLSSSVAPDIDRLGLFLPYTPLHHLLLSELNRPLVATSANRSGEPIITAANEIYAHLGEVVDAILDHNRPILNGCDDSVVQMINGQLQVIRLARGYAPLTLHWQQQVSAHTLALGAQQKNSIAFGFGHNLVLSPHIGDLFSVEAEQYFIDTLATFKRLYRFTPQYLVSDKHPEYASNRWAKQYCQTHDDIERFQVQHHYAHILSIMAVNQYTDKVLGFSFDGTGLGDKQQLWGGEAMLADINGYQRIAHLKPFALIGNEQAIKDPRRIMLALLFDQYTPDELSALNIAAVQSLPPSVINNLYQLWHKKVASYQTSSIGRLFDALACVLGLMEKTLFEGQAGMLIEACANQVSVDQLVAANIHFDLPLIDGVWQTDLLWQQIVTLLLASEPLANKNALIARGFMDCLARATANLAAQYPSLPVVLSGGVFQNRYLLSRSQDLLKQHSLLPSKQVPVNDGGIALGQLWYGIHQQH